MEDEAIEVGQRLEEHVRLYDEGIDVNIRPYEIADILSDIRDTDERSFIEALRKLPEELLAETLIELSKEAQQEAYQDFDAKELADLVSKLDTDDAADLIQHVEHMDEGKAAEVLENLDEEDRFIIEQLIAYEEDEAGAHMQNELFEAHIDESIGRSVRRLKRLKQTGVLGNIHHAFVVGAHRRFIGMISLEDLILHGPDEYYKDVLVEGHSTISVKPNEKIESVVEVARNYNIDVLPVVDDRGILLGRITSDDIYWIMQKQATDQIYNLAGVAEEAEEEESLINAGKTRALWLGLNLLTAIAASIVIGLFDTTIQSLVALAVLMPIVASMGGNAGTQTLTVTVRQLALGDIGLEEAREVVGKEVLISLANGMLFAIVMGVIAYLWFGLAMLGVVIGISMVINLFSAGFFGAVIPLGLKRAGIDPAIGSTVLLTTVTDVVGFFSFLGLATLILL